MSMQASFLLSETDMAKARSPDDLRAWTINKCGELNQSAEAKAFSQSGSKLPKKFHDEIYPLSLFVTREYQGRSDVSVQPNLDNDNFDARITAPSIYGVETIYVEITFAKDGYDQSLRMEVLAKKGGVTMTGPVTASGRRGAANREVKVTPRAVSNAETVQQHLQLIETRVKAKTNVAYGSDHVLLVVVDDYLALMQDSDWPLLAARAEVWASDPTLDFGRLVILGASGHLFLSYDLACRPKA
jgi:hypothetical protein